MNRKNIDNQGMTLVEIMVAVSILAIITVGLVNFMTIQQRESRAINETLARQNLERYLIGILADGSLCSAEFAGKAPAPFTVNQIRSKAPTVAQPNPPVAISVVAPFNQPEPMASSFVISPAGGIAVQNFQQTGGPDSYQAELVVSFVAGNLIRPLLPIRLKLSFKVVAGLITGCMGGQNEKETCERLGGTYDPANIPPCLLPAVYM